jgi:hypothetical protein
MLFNRVLRSVHKTDKKSQILKSALISNFSYDGMEQHVLDTNAGKQLS